MSVDAKAVLHQHTDTNRIQWIRWFYVFRRPNNNRLAKK